MSTDVPVLPDVDEVAVKTARVISRGRLELIGNVLLVSFLWAMILLVIWWVAWLFLCHSPLLATVAPAWFGVNPQSIVQLNVVALALWKLAAFFVFLVPGLACRCVAAAMKRG